MKENKDYSGHKENVVKIDYDPDVIKIKNPWKIATIILGLITLILLYMINTNTGLSASSISGENAGKIVTDFLNLQTGGGVNYISYNDLKDIYEITVSYEGQNVPVYITKNGNYFVQSAIPISDSIPSQLPDDQELNQRINDVSPDDDAIKGEVNAPVTIIEFSDYECPFCGRFFEQTLPELNEAYIKTGKVKLIYRDFPLDIHPNAQKAAEAAECAGEQGKYYEMHDKLFENQNALDVGSLKKYAKDIGLNTDEFNKCLDSGKMSDEVSQDFIDGQSYGVTGTPTFFINGKPLLGAQPFSEFEKIIMEGLNE